MLRGTYHSIHLGKGREIVDFDRDGGPKFHVSVRDRMGDKSLKYEPKAHWKHGTEQYVE